MEKVAEHINEMQRIHEEYGAIFDHLFRQHQKASKQVRASGSSPRLAAAKGSSRVAKNDAGNLLRAAMAREGEAEVSGKEVEGDKKNGE